jgi:DNA-binding winged helix-turn-helix (wHTH) protein
MRYVFAGCVLDTRLYTLHQEGTTVRLRPKAFHVMAQALWHLGYPDQVLEQPGNS